MAEDKEADVEKIEGALEGHRVGEQTNLQFERFNYRVERIIYRHLKSLWAF